MPTAKRFVNTFSQEGFSRVSEFYFQPVAMAEVPSLFQVHLLACAHDMSCHVV